jgi:UDP:flavonoid glycosyltransferase YjiC (YdhE family)
LIDRYNSGRESGLSWTDLLQRAELFLTIHDHHIESASLPLFPNVVPVPGLTVRPAEPLPEALANIFADAEPHGIIAVSFGSTQSRMPTEIMRKFFEVFGRLQQTVIARFDVPDGLYVAVPSNVKMLSWLPQNDILGHRKTRLFITHCGHHSLHEAVYHGVPMIGFPLFGDHHWNCEQARRKHLVVVMNILDFDVDQLHQNIIQLLAVNSSYRQSVTERSAIYRDQPIFGRKKAAFWLEHVINHGSQYLRSAAQTMPLYQMWMLDILAVGCVILTAFLAATILCFRLCFRLQSEHCGVNCEDSGEPTISSDDEIGVHSSSAESQFDHRL